MARIKFTYQQLSLLEEWIPEANTQIEINDLPTAIAVFNAFELHERLSVFLARYRNPSKFHSLKIPDSQLCALLLYIHRIAHTLDSDRYMELSRIKRAIEEILFVKGPLNPKIYA